MTSLPDVIDADFLARLDVFAMDATTPGVGNDPTRWPDEVINPRNNNVQYISFDVNADYSNRSDGNLAAGILAPRQGGASINEKVFWIAYDSSALPFKVYADHPTQRAGKATFDQIQLNNFGVYSPFYIHIYGLSLLNVMQWRARGCIVERCEWDDVQTQCVRFRYGASDNALLNSYFYRSAPFDTTSDRVCLQISDGRSIPNEDILISGNTILNFTDALQITADDTTTYGTAPGVVAENNFMGITAEAISGNQSLEGIENCIDLKAGGTEDNPVVFRNNVFFGLRPNAGTPGYAINIKELSQYFVMYDNIFSDCESGIFFNTQYEDNDSGNPFFTPKVDLINNQFFEIRNNGSGLFPTKAGVVFTGDNVPDVFEGNVIKNCDTVFELLPNDATQGWPFDPDKSNVIYEPVVQGALPWPEQIVTATGDEELPVPYAGITITVGKQ